MHLREPFDGVRYGVEFDGEDYTVDGRNPDGTPGGGPVPITFHEHRPPHAGHRRAQRRGRRRSREVALHLEQRPYVQVFTQSTAETQGSKTPPPNLLVPLRNGRTFALKFAPQALFQPGTD